MGLTISENGVSQISWWGDTHFDWDLIGDIVVTKRYTPRLIGRGKVDRHLFQVGLSLTERWKKHFKGNFPFSHPTSWTIAALRTSIVDVAELDVYPPVVPHLLEFYFDHPELRSELGTERALERVRTGDFVVDP